MGFINSSGLRQVIKDILLKSYLKRNFENSEIRDFVSTSWKFIKEESS